MGVFYIKDLFLAEFHFRSKINANTYRFLKLDLLEWVPFVP
jgi:hypothetical protein